MVLAWILTTATLCKSIVYEKDRRLKEVMKIMGLGNGVHWVAWFINAFVMMFLTTLLLVIILKVSCSKLSYKLLVLYWRSDLHSIHILYPPVSLSVEMSGLYWWWKPRYVSDTLENLIWRPYCTHMLRMGIE